MKRNARKAALTAYKERKVIAGIYSVRCEVTGEQWVGHWPDLATIRTRLWFSLRQGSVPNVALRQAWRSHGEASFTFSVLEELDGEMTAYIQAATLKERAAHWRDALNAKAL